MTPIRPQIQIKPQSKSIKKDRSPKKTRKDDSKSDSELEVDTMDPPYSQIFTLTCDVDPTKSQTHSINILPQEIPKGRKIIPSKNQ